MPPHCSLLLRTLCSMARHEGPSAFFDFADAGAGIVRNAALRCALLLMAICLSEGHLEPRSGDHGLLRSTFVSFCKDTLELHLSGRRRHPWALGPALDARGP